MMMRVTLRTKGKGRGGVWGRYGISNIWRFGVFISGSCEFWLRRSLLLRLVLFKGLR